MKKNQYILLLIAFVGQIYAQNKYQQVEIETLEQPAVSIESNLSSLLGIDSSNTFKLTTIPVLLDELGFEHYRYQQYYKNIKVENAILIVHKKNDDITSVNGEFLKDFTGEITPSISESNALNFALNDINAENYIWQKTDGNETLNDNSILPKAELVICKNYNVSTNVDPNKLYRLAYKLDIYATKPLGRYFVYVDAQNGEILFKNSLINDCHESSHSFNMFKNKQSIETLGNAQTRYSGARNIETTINSQGYKLLDNTRGLGVETFNLNRSTDYNLATNFIDNDNNWTAAEWNNAYKDNAALDTHWGSARTYDYFLQKHNRKSFDNANAKIKSYVHYSTNYFNAFWNGSVMTYGDGSSINNYNPLTSIDVAAHEIGHAVCSYSANLIYSYESGALNESFSDIWGSCVEYFADPSKQTWVLGEDFQYPIRSLSNPKIYGQPNTYKGINWYYGSGDAGGVHTNSGVQNYWFYLLAVGSSGTNDNGTAYNVTGIGIEKAAKIAYRTESVYLSPNSQYVDARNYSIRANVVSLRSSY